RQAIEHNTTKAVGSLNVLHSLGLSASGFTCVLAARIYAQFIRPQWFCYPKAAQKTHETAPGYTSHLSTPYLW
ncbi:hypothetical protein BDB00DRAFT_776949, partial [Zychaea mexicana]|uniref:uncharacterized protein n=1 Tax=Zychaea mexicana TaxID=64656 RepID=UPI0022FF013E